MKLRLQGDSIRFRLTQGEVANLAAGQKVEASVRFAYGPKGVLTYAIRTAPKPNGVKADFSEQEICVTLPDAVAQTWATTDQVSIEHLQPTGDDGFLRILVEKDFRCLHSEAGQQQDEGDTFPNPADVAAH